jgi:hypothetical protein
MSLPGVALGFSGMRLGCHCRGSKWMGYGGDATRPNFVDTSRSAVAVVAEGLRYGRNNPFIIHRWEDGYYIDQLRFSFLSSMFL